MYSKPGRTTSTALSVPGSTAGAKTANVNYYGGEPSELLLIPSSHWTLTLYVMRPISLHLRSLSRLLFLMTRLFQPSKALLVPGAMVDGDN